MYSHLLQTTPVVVHHLQSYSWVETVEQHDVIQRSWNSEKSMPNPSLLIGHHFKDYSGTFFLAMELSMPSLRSVPPTPMHTIYWAKHTWEPASFIHLQKPRDVFIIGSSKIFRTKHLLDSNSEALDTYDRFTLTDGKWSSTTSAGIPYANIRKAAVTILKQVLCLSSPAAFLLCWKNRSCLASLSAMCLNNSMFILKCRQK